MNKSIVTTAVLIGFLTILSCASAPVLPPEWRYEKEAIRLTLQADPRLNLYNNTPHTLQLCFYQLKDPNGFNQLTETEEGLYKLLEGSMFDASVANFKRLNMSPGQSTPFIMDRAEGARFIGIAAGYATIQKDRITRLINIPVITVEEGSGFKKQKVSRPEMINLKLRLGPQQIEDIKGE
ncbi:MAG: type VI secretion system lipoprotein TssJ [Deltaproteobacteria bacterium]|nr:type VI secretion system lipoprotein TssJ [Deltaproteobacteria bacterium]